MPATFACSSHCTQLVEWAAFPSMPQLILWNWFEMKQANILTSAAAYKTDHCAGRSNKFLCVYLFAQAAHAAEQQRRRLRRLICALFRSHKQAHVVPSGRGRAGQRGWILSIFIKRLTHVQFSSVRGWPTFSLPSGWAVANICLTSTWTWTQSTNTQPQATPSPAQPSPEQTIPKPPRRNGYWGLWLHDYGVSGAAGAIV